MNNRKHLIISTVCDAVRAGSRPGRRGARGQSSIIININNNNNNANDTNNTMFTIISITIITISIRVIESTPHFALGASAYVDGATNH